VNADPIDGGFVVFGQGYDCLFSFSITDPSACGLSWSSGLHRAAVGAITDLSGHLLSSKNPVYQGQDIVMWATGLGGLPRNGTTGLLQQSNPLSVGFGVSQNGTDLPSTIGSGFDGDFGTFQTRHALWAGESPEFVGLEQINITFPMCATQTKATVEKRYDAFMIFESIESGTPTRIYLPFIVRPGDPDCQWTFATTTTLTASLNPSVSGQSVKFVAIVSPPAASRTVSFFDGATALGSSNLSVVGVLPRRR